MSVFGYARVSTLDQETTSQLERLRSAGAVEVVEERISGVTSWRARPLLSALVARLLPGDVLVTAFLDRLGRDPGDVLTLVSELRARGVVFRSADIGVDTSTEAGDLMLSLLAVVAGWERRRLHARIAEGRAVARAEGRSLGRRFALTAGQRREAIRMAADGRSVTDVARALGTSRSTAHRAMSREVKQ